MTAIRLTRVGPATTIQDRGRFGGLRHGISASGPMDRAAFFATAAALATPGGEAIEFSRTGLAFEVEGGAVEVALAGGAFGLTHNGAPQPWPALLALAAGDRVEVVPGAGGNYGYLRFAADIEVPMLLGSRATNLLAGLGGLEGRALRAGDRLTLAPPTLPSRPVPAARPSHDGPIRFIWGLHAELFSAAVRARFVAGRFLVSSRLDRMGVRLDDPGAVLAGAPILSLVSDAIVPGDIQILGDGTPIILMRDHQPTGGYPRIGTVIAADLDRLAQLRPGAELAFSPISLQNAQALYLFSGGQ